MRDSCTPRRAAVRLTMVLVASVITERFQRACIVGPATPHAHPRLQVHAFVEHGSDIRARKTADLAQLGALRADNDRLVRLALDQESGEDFNLLVGFMPAFDRYRDPVWKLIAEQAERLFPNQLGRKETNVAIGVLIGIE